MLIAAGIIAGILQIVATAPYARDILRGRTRPQRATWSIWFTLSLVVLASQLADGGTWSLLLVAFQAVACGAIVGLSVRRGVGGTSALDLSLVAIAALGIVGWRVSSNPTVATAAVILADTMAVVLMLPKAYTSPRSETAAAYGLGCVSAAFAVLAVGSLDPALLAYPVYILVADGVLVSLIVARRRVVPVLVEP